MSSDNAGGSLGSSHLSSVSNVAGEVRGSTGTTATAIRNMSSGNDDGSSGSNHLSSVSNVAREVRGATGTATAIHNMSSDIGDVASSTRTPQKEDIILKIKDIVLGDRKNISHIGSYPIKRITLNNVRFFMSANSIKLNSKT